MNNLVLETIKNRRTTRAFTGEQIKREELEAVIEAGLYAPSAHNQQSWHFTVIQNKELLEQLNFDAKEEGKKASEEYTRNMSNNVDFNIFYNAPTVIIVSGDSKSILPDTDCAAASQNMLIAAESIGLGACWNGIVALLLRSDRAKEYKDKLSIPDTHNPYYAIVLGYKKTNSANPLARRAGTVTYF